MNPFFVLTTLIIIAMSSQSLACKPNQSTLFAQEQQFYQEIAANHHPFFAENHLISYIGNAVKNDFQPLRNMLDDRLSLLYTINQSYFVFLLIIFILWATYLTSIKAGNFFKTEVSPLKKIPLQKVRRVLAFLLLVTCLLIFGESYKGVSEAQELRRSLSEISCKLLTEPRGLLRSNNNSVDIGYDSFLQYTDTVDDKIVYNLQLLRPSVEKLLLANQFLQIAEKVIQHLEIRNQTSEFFGEFNQSFLDLQKMYEDQGKKNKIRSNFSQIYIEQQLVSFFIKCFRIIQTSLRNYNQSFQMQGIVNIWTNTCKTFFIIIIFLSIAIASYSILNHLCRKRLVKESTVLWIQFILCSIIFTCIFTFIVCSFLITASSTFYNSQRLFLKDSETFQSQFLMFGKADSKVPGISLLLSPFNKTLNSIKNISIIKENMQFSVVYSTKKDTYFFDMLNESLAYIEDQGFKERIVADIEQKNMTVKLPFATYIKEFNEAVAMILDSMKPNGVFERINGAAFGEVWTDFLRTSSLLITNRAFQSHRICGRLSVLLSLAFVLIFFAHMEGLSSRENVKTLQEIADGEQSDPVQISIDNISSQTL